MTSFESVFEESLSVSLDPHIISIWMTQTRRSVSKLRMVQHVDRLHSKYIIGIGLAFIIRCRRHTKNKNNNEYAERKEKRNVFFTRSTDEENPMWISAQERTREKRVSKKTKNIKHKLLLDEVAVKNKYLIFVFERSSHTQSKTERETHSCTLNFDIYNAKRQYRVFDSFIWFMHCSAMQAKTSIQADIN